MAELKPLRRAPLSTPVVELTEGCIRLRAACPDRVKLAEAVGISRQSAGAWLLGRSRPSFDKAVALFKIYKIDPRAWSYLAGWRG